MTTKTATTTSNRPPVVPPAPARAALHHIALGARDVQRVAEFYRDVFGLVELARHFQLDGQLRSVWLDLVGAILMIEHSEEPSRRVAGVGAGPFLLAFRVEPTQRTALEAVLTSKGHAIEARTDHSSYARDPEGNRVAISHYPLEVAPATSG